MTEWYVYCELGLPREVILGRRDAIERLTMGLTLQSHEKRRLGFLKGGTPNLYEAYEVGRKRWDGIPERSICRVIGPGTEV